jgi:hypothetical protein
MRFGVFMEMKIVIVVLWTVMQCSYQLFEGTCWF